MEAATQDYSGGLIWRTILEGCSKPAANLERHELVRRVVDERQVALFKVPRLRSRVSEHAVTVEEDDAIAADGCDGGCAGIRSGLEAGPLPRPELLLKAQVGLNVAALAHTREGLVVSQPLLAHQPCDHHRRGS